MPVMQSVATRMIVRRLEKQVRMKSVPVLHGLNRRFAVQGRLGSLVVVVPSHACLDTPTMLTLLLALPAISHKRRATIVR